MNQQYSSGGPGHGPNPGHQFGQGNYPRQGNYPNQGNYPGQSNYAGQGNYPQSTHQGQPPKARPLGPILMILGVVAAIVSLFLPWNHHMEFVHGEGGLSVEKKEAMNAFDQILVNMDAGRSHGLLMLIAVLLAIACCVVVVVASVMALSRPGSGGTLALVGAIVGLIATAGVFLGYLGLGAAHEAEFGMWIYAASFVPVLIGGIGVASKKF